MNPSLSLDKSVNYKMWMIMEPISFKWTVLKELINENPLGQNLAHRTGSLPSVGGPLTLQTNALLGYSVPRVTVGEKWPTPRAGLQLLALRAQGTFQGAGSRTRKGPWPAGCCRMRGTGLTLGVGYEDLTPLPPTLQ